MLLRICQQHYQQLLVVYDLHKKDLKPVTDYAPCCVEK